MTILSDEPEIKDVMSKYCTLYCTYTNKTIAFYRVLCTRYSI